MLHARPGRVPTKREMRFGFDAIDITIEKSEFLAGRMVFMKVFSDISKEFLEPQKFFSHLMSNVRKDNPNGMHIEENLPDIRKNVSDITEEQMQVENDCADITKEISDAGKKLPHMGKVQHDDNAASRDIEKSLAHVTDALMQVDPATRMLRENPFELLSYPPDMHEGINDVVFPSARCIRRQSCTRSARACRNSEHPCTIPPAPSATTTPCSALK